MLFPLSHNFTNAAEHPRAELNVSPKVCVARVGEPCRMDLEVSWTAQGTMDLCLRLGGGESPLACWRDSREGSHTMSYASEENVLLQLVNESLHVLDEVEIKVVSRDLRDSRSRRRHVWSIL